MSLAAAYPHMPNDNINLGYLEHLGYVKLVGLDTPFQSEQEFNHL
jgi:hypothetical protein